MTIQYNPAQLEVISAVDDVLNGGPSPIVVTGAGGTGKTTCVMDSVKRALASGKSVLLCAPTNKAVEVLYLAALAAGISAGSGVQFATLHSALGLRMLPDEDTKQVAKVSDGFIFSYDLVIIDECSMLGRYLVHKILMPTVEAFNVPVVFMGDEKQLFPVRETMSPVFEMFPVYNLNKVERFAAQSEIAKINKHLRGTIDNHVAFNYEPMDGASGGVFPMKDRFFKEFVREHFSSEYTDPRKSVVVAWRNRTVDAYNSMIRTARFGKDAPRLVEGELMRVGATIMAGKESWASVDDEIVVQKFVPCQELIYDENQPDVRFLSDKVLALHERTGATRWLNILAPESENEVFSELNRLANLAKRNPVFWKQFWKLKDTFQDLRYPYCITVHKSQGSTYEEVFVDVKDITGCRALAERQRLLYVACSRPSKSLYVNVEQMRA